MLTGFFTTVSSWGTVLGEAITVIAQAVSHSARRGIPGGRQS
jgi:hypothetical protein